MHEPELKSRMMEKEADLYASEEWEQEMMQQIKLQTSADPALHTVSSILASKPTKGKEKGILKWEELGPIDLEEWVSSGIVTFDGSKELMFEDSYLGQKDGIGRNYWNAILIEEGEFKNGNLHGYGRRIYEEGDYYVGQFSHDKRHGQGKYVKTDGVVQDGRWDKNTFLG